MFLLFLFTNVSLIKSFCPMHLCCCNLSWIKVQGLQLIILKAKNVLGLKILFEYVQNIRSVEQAARHSLAGSCGILCQKRKASQATL
jgi:hypothetical protein